MGPDQLSELSKDERKELSIGLLRDWWITASQALVDSVGPEAALAAMRPHFVNSGKAGGMVYQRLMGLGPDDHVARIYGMVMALVTMMDADYESLWVGEDGSMLCEVRGCGTNGICKEACLSFCGIAIPNAHSPLEVTLEKSRAFGDASCEWSYHHQGREPQVEPSDRYLLVDEDRRKYTPSDEITEYLALAYAGEFWVMATRAFADKVGSRTTIQILSPYMRLSGQSLGT
jgi:hypothetical protein